MDASWSSASICVSSAGLQQGRTGSLKIGLKWKYSGSMPNWLSGIRGSKAPGSSFVKSTTSKSHWANRRSCGLSADGSIAQTKRACTVLLSFQTYRGARFTNSVTASVKKCLDGFSTFAQRRLFHETKNHSSLPHNTFLGQRYLHDS